MIGARRVTRAMAAVPGPLLQRDGPSCNMTGRPRGRHGGPRTDHDGMGDHRIIGGSVHHRGGPSPSPSWAHDGDDATGGDGDDAAPLVREGRDRFPDLRPARSLMRGCGAGAGAAPGPGPPIRSGRPVSPTARPCRSGPCAGAHAVPRGRVESARAVRAPGE